MNAEVILCENRMCHTDLKIKSQHLIVSKRLAYRILENQKVNS